MKICVHLGGSSKFVGVVFVSFHFAFVSFLDSLAPEFGQLEITEMWESKQEWNREQERTPEMEVSILDLGCSPQRDRVLE